MGGSAAIWQVPDEAPPLEVDLRGMEVDEALRVLDSGLDRGVLAGLSELRIIHGVGRGILRGAVERHLREHPQVASHRTGQVGEGGRGVTVARLK
jgi:DNA mismatch repair protein MutS2